MNSIIILFSGTLATYCKALLADDMGTKFCCNCNVKQSGGEKSG